MKPATASVFAALILAMYAAGFYLAKVIAGEDYGTHGPMGCATLPFFAVALAGALVLGAIVVIRRRTSPRAAVVIGLLPLAVIVASILVGIAIVSVMG